MLTLNDSATLWAKQTRKEIALEGGDGDRNVNTCMV
jgi:hypothetical protein